MAKHLPCVRFSSKNRWNNDFPISPLRPLRALRLSLKRRVILEVTDSGDPPLTRYRRIIVTGK